MIGRLATTLTRLAHRTGRHHYLSTGCLHGNHAYCQNRHGQAGPKQPATCKFCGAPCVCRCHRTSTGNMSRCVCGDPIELQDPSNPHSWIHSPGSDTPCLNARPTDI